MVRENHALPLVSLALTAKIVSQAFTAKIAMLLHDGFGAICRWIRRA